MTRAVPSPVRALIAEDEPLLAQALRQELLRLWPELDILPVAGDGHSAVEQALQLRPDVLFMDIRMPGQDGLHAAAQMADEWPAGQRFPALVFVSAYDQYAVQAFEQAAVDYVLKPVQPQRLAQTVQRVRERLAQPGQGPAGAASQPDDAGSLEAVPPALLAQLRSLLASSGSDARAAAAAPLQTIQASVGQSIRMVPLAEVLVFEAADKYVRVLTASHEYLIRTPLKDLLPRLDADEFWQVHRGTVVRASAIDSVSRDEAGRSWLQLRGRSERLAVSRLYAHLFRAM